MTVFVLGATGRTGKLIVRELLAEGYTVHAIARRPAALVPHPNLKVFEGSPQDVMLLKKSMEGCSAILSSLNISRTSDFPWAPLRSPATLLSEVLSKVITLSGQLGIKRIIIVTAWGTDETKADIPSWFRWVIDHSNVGYPYRDHERQEQMIRNTDLDWTVVRPVGLTNSTRPATAKVSIDNVPCPGLTISRLTTARFLLKVLREDLFIRQLPVIFG